MNALTTASTLPEEGKLAEITREIFGFKSFGTLLALLIVVAFWEVIWGSQTFFFRDYGIFGYPAAHFHKECFWRGEIPLWNPLNSCGLPFLAQWNTLALYPGSLIYLLLPLPWSLSFYCLVHLVLAGCGMYRLAMAWTGHQLAAAVAGMGFAFSGLILNALMWPNNVAALGWMPWVVLLVERGWLQGGRRLLLAILIAAVQMLAGAPEIILFTWAILAAVWAGHFWRQGDLRGRLLPRGALTVAFVTGLVAAQILPFLDLLLHSQRGANFSDAHWAMPSTGWVHFFLPLFGFYQSPSGVCFQPNQEWTSSYYAGVGIVLLAMVSLRIINKPRVLLLWIITGVGFILALGDGGWVYPALSKMLPLLSVMRFPIKFVVLMIFALPLLAAFGVSALEKGNGARWWAIGAAVVCVAVIASALAYAYVKPPTRLPWPTLAENAATRLACILVIGVAGVFLGRSQWRTRAILGCTLAATIALDAFTHVPWQNPTVTPAVYEPGLLQTQVSPLPGHGTNRAMMMRRTHDIVYGWMLPDTFKDYCGRRLSMFGNCNVLDNVPTPDGFYSLYLPQQREIWADLFFATNSLSSKPVADFVGLSQAITNLFEWENRPTALPMATAGQTPVFAEATEIRARMKTPDFDPQRTVFLSAELKDRIKAGGKTARVIEARWENNRGEIAVEAAGPTLLVVAQSFHHGWRAYVKGKPTEILRANHAFQAVETPAGRSKVTFAYEDKAFRAGSAASLISLLIWGGMWLRQRRNATEPQASP